jgi:hypothetical protein
MFSAGERVQVKDPDGPGWIAAEFHEVAEGQPRHVDHPGINDGRGYDPDQFWVTYLEGDRRGTTGLHTMVEIRPPE